MTDMQNYKTEWITLYDALGNEHRLLAFVAPDYEGVFFMEGEGGTAEWTLQLWDIVNAEES